MADKERLDVLLVKIGLAETREKAKALIMTGKVLVDNVPEDKAGKKIDVKSEIRYKGKMPKYVSRGGLKLEKAILDYKLNLENKVCLDIGSSTGGFTDCMLQNGARKVYAIDVGTNQLAWKLRSDDRVVSMEKTNVRNLTEDMIEDKGDFASFDVSFISLEKVLVPVLAVTNETAEFVCLIKPQFEAGREKVGKKGVVREKKTHLEVVNKIVDFVKEHNLYIKGLTYSPIKGPEGNIEYLIYLTKVETAEDYDVDKTVNGAFSDL